MNRCKTCRFKRHLYRDTQFCAAVSEGFENVTKQKLATAICLGDGGGSELCVTDEFGCVLHEERKPE